MWGYACGGGDSGGVEAAWWRDVAVIHHAMHT